MRNLFFVILLLLSVTNSQAQLSFGPTASLNVATQQWKGNYAGNYRLTPLIAFQAGVFGNYKLQEKWGAQVELLYSSEGTREKNTAFSGSGHISFNFLRLPLLAQYYIVEELHVEAGPNIGYLLGGKEKWNGESENIQEGYKKIDAGLNIGAGYNLSKLARGLTAGVRFYYGLTNMVKADNLNGGGFKNRVFSLNIRYALPLGK